MNNPDTDLLFPMRVIPSLVDLRNLPWQKLVVEICDKPDEDIDKIAFSALLMKVAGCLGCAADSYRALKGCTQCARLVIKRYKGTDEELIKMYDDSRNEVINQLEKMQVQNSGLGK